MKNKDDWRIRNQDEYLSDIPLIHKRFRSDRPQGFMPDDNQKKYNDHKHCDFCWHKFMEDCKDDEDCSIDGYCTLDERIWICEKCYEDFKGRFRWTIVNEE